MNVLVTGASGFIGRHLPGICGNMVFSALPRPHRLTGEEISEEIISHLRVSEVVLHLAGLAHGNYSPHELDAVNHLATVQLAKAAAASGIKRFVYLSTVNVLGNTTCGKPYDDL